MAALCECHGCNVAHASRVWGVPLRYTPYEHRPEAAVDTMRYRRLRGSLTVREWAYKVNHGNVAAGICAESSSFRTAPMLCYDANARGLVFKTPDDMMQFIYQRR